MHHQVDVERKRVRGGTKDMTDETITTARIEGAKA
jgi:hypothetical protein